MGAKFDPLLGQLRQQDGGGQVNSVVAGTNVTVNNTDPVNPIVSSSTPSATNSTQGIIELAGDLAGTASSPTVTNLHLSGDTAVNHKLTSLSTPTVGNDATNKTYVDNAVAGSVNPWITNSTSGISKIRMQGPATVWDMTIDDTGAWNMSQVGTAGLAITFANGLTGMDFANGTTPIDFAA